MKRSIKILIFLNILFYVNLFVLSYRISLLGMKQVNPLWLVTPYFFAFILIFPLSRQFKIKRIYGYIDFGIRFLAIIINYIGGNQQFSSKNYTILISIVVIIFIINILIEIFLYRKYKNYYIENNLKDLSFTKIPLLSQDENVRQQMKSTRGRVFRHWFNWWNLVLSLMGFIIAIIFIISNKWFFIIMGFVILLLVPYFTLKSINSHFIILDYAEYELNYKKKRKIINILGVVISFVFAFCITFFGGRDLSYANGFVVIFLLPFYNTEKTAMIKSKEELDSILKNSNKEE